MYGIVASHKGESSGEWLARWLCRYQRAVLSRGYSECHLHRRKEQRSRGPRAQHSELEAAALEELTDGFALISAVGLVEIDDA